jgi:hypothetical protein
MNRNQVLVRTAKGQDEVLTKAYHLPPELRHLLIRVDEDCSVGETLDQFAGSANKTESQLETLVVEGFLAPQESTPEMDGLNVDQWELLAAGLLDPRDLQPEGEAIPECAFNLEKAKDYARLILLESLCPVDAHHVECIDAARTVGELRVELDDLRELLPRLLPKRQARQVWEQLEPLMLPLGADPAWHSPPPNLLERWALRP